MSKELIEKFSNDPSLAEKNLMVKVTKGENFRAVMKIGDLEWQTDAPEGLGGDGDGPSPLFVMLGLIGSCQCTVAQFWSQKMGVKIDEMEVMVRGQINLQELLGEKDGPIGFRSFSVRTKIKSSAPKEKVEEMMKQVNSHCPVFSNVMGETDMEIKTSIVASD
ncbi:hypothetical protein GF325_09540 [Candidatus Bathyarchaeota archaeon]|nr:hypothetical protein [Candidatus Bathyarchaeota archaeon]